MEIINQQNKLQKFQWYLLGISLLFCCISAFLFQEINANRGLSYDGLLYYQITEDFEHKIFEGNISAYYLKRSVPSAIVYVFFSAINQFCHLIGLSPVEITQKNVILSFSIISILGIISSNYYLFKIYDKFGFDKKLQILCFLLFNLTFVVAKWSFYYPVLTDHFALFIAVAILYAYFFSKSYYLLLLFFIGYFTFPTLFVVASLLFIFPYKKIERKSFEIKKNVLLAIFVASITFSILLFTYKWQAMLYINGNIVGMLDNDALSNGESPINKTLLSIAIMCVIFYFLLITVAFNPVTIFNKIIQQIQIAKFILISICVIFLSQLIKYYFPATGFLPLDFLGNLATQAIKEPLAFFFSHFFYFGVAFILPFMYYKYWYQISEKIGLGAVLVLFFHSILMIGSESRQFLAIFPILIVFSGLLLKKYFVVDNKAIAIMSGFSFLMSTIWLPINQIFDYECFNVDKSYLYAIHQGPWMPSDFYYTLLLPVSLIMIITLKFTLKLKKEI